MARKSIIPICIAVFLTLTFSSCSCIYFNTFHNIRKNFNGAEKNRKKEGRDVARGGENKQYTDAIARASKVLERHPTSSWVDDALYIIGASYYYLGDFSQSERKFRELLANYPQSEFIPRARILLAKAKLQLKDEAGAIVLFEDIFANEKDKTLKAGAARSLGEYYFKAKDYERANSYFTALIDSLGEESEKLRARMYVADGYFGLYLFAKAKVAYEDALEHKPDTLQHYRIMFQLAQCDYFLNDLAGGLDRLSKLADNELYYDSLAPIRLKMAEGYEWDGDLNSAIGTYEKVIVENPKSDAAAIAYHRLGLIYQYDYEDLAKARAYYQKAQNEKRNSPIYEDATRRASKLAMLEQYTQTGQVAATDTTGEMDDAAKDRVTESQFLLGELFYLDLEKPDSALTAFETLVEKYPDSRYAPRALISMAYIYRTDFADTMTADSLLRQVLIRYPRYDEAKTVVDMLGLAGTKADSGYAAVPFKKAESFLEQFIALHDDLYRDKWVADSTRAADSIMAADTATVVDTAASQPPKPQPGDTSRIAGPPKPTPADTSLLAGPPSSTPSDTSRPAGPLSAKDTFNLVGPPKPSSVDTLPAPSRPAVVDTARGTRYQAPPGLPPPSDTMSLTEMVRQADSVRRADSIMMAEMRRTGDSTKVLEMARKADSLQRADSLRAAALQRTADSVRANQQTVKADTGVAQRSAGKTDSLPGTVFVPLPDTGAKPSAEVSPFNVPLMGPPRPTAADTLPITATTPPSQTAGPESPIMGPPRPTAADSLPMTATTPPSQTAGPENPIMGPPRPTAADSLVMTATTPPSQTAGPENLIMGPPRPTAADSALAGGVSSPETVGIGDSTGVSGQQPPAGEPEAEAPVDTIPAIDYWKEAFITAQETLDPRLLNLLDSAHYYYSLVIDSFPFSDYSLKARYDILWAYDKYLAPGDSSLLAMYRTFVDSFPESEFTVAIGNEYGIRPTGASRKQERRQTPTQQEEQFQDTTETEPQQPPPGESDTTLFLPGVDTTFITDQSGNRLRPANEYFLREDVPFVYPLEAVAYNIEDKLYFQIRIDFSGEVVEMKLMNPTPSGELNEAIQRTVKQTKFDARRIPAELYDHWFYYTYTVTMPREYRQ